MLQIEKENLVKQLEIEHERQKAAQIAVVKTQEDLEDLESRYADAIAELNNLQLQQFTYDSDDTSALSEDSSITNTVPESSGKCFGENKAKLQRLYENQLSVARDCDITASYYNRLIELYESISDKNLF